MKIGSWAPRMGEERVAKMMCLAVCWVGVLRAAGVRKTGSGRAAEKEQESKAEQSMVFGKPILSSLSQPNIKIPLQF